VKALPLNAKVENSGCSRSNPIKAVHLLHTIAYGGIETILINWFRKLKDDSNAPIELSLVCFANQDQSEQAFLEAARREGIDVETIPWSRRKPIFSSGKKLAKLLRQKNAQVLHTHNTYADLTGLLAARLTGVRTVSSVYVWSDFGWKRNVLQWINQWALRSFDGVTAQCRTTLQQTCARGIDEKKVRILPSGFELNQDSIPSRERFEQRRSFGAADNDLVLINVARLYPEKAQDNLLREFQKAVALHPNLKLWILGVGPLEAELKALAGELRLEDRVRFFGFCNDLHRVLNLADIQVHPSHAEGIPMSILSGMASALPIIASDVGGISEVLEDNVSALLVPPASHPQFADRFQKAVVKLVSNRDLGTRLASQAAAFIRNEYSMEAALRKLEQLYRDVLVR
jgi:glycosyltransferase involved in cell wall biosynthesis